MAATFILSLKEKSQMLSLRLAPNGAYFNLKMQSAPLYLGHVGKMAES